MKLINKSRWATQDLRKIVLECIRIEGCRKDLLVEIATLRRDASGYVRGDVYLNGRHIRIRLKTPSEISNHAVHTEEQFLQLLKHFFAQTTLHEIQHTRGNDHRDMIKPWDLNVDWVQEFELRPKKGNSKPKRNLREERYQNVLRLIKKNETRLKRTKTALKKLYQKKKYYERAEV